MLHFGLSAPHNLVWSQGCRDSIQVPCHSTALLFLSSPKSHDGPRPPRLAAYTVQALCSTLSLQCPAFGAYLCAQLYWPQWHNNNNAMTMTVTATMAMWQLQSHSRCDMTTMAWHDEVVNKYCNVKVHCEVYVKILMSQVFLFQAIDLECSDIGRCAECLHNEI